MNAEEARRTVKEYSKTTPWVLDNVLKQVKESAKGGYYSTVFALSVMEMKVVGEVEIELAKLGYATEVDKYSSPQMELWVSWKEHEGDDYN